MTFNEPSMPSATFTDLTLRPAGPEDADAVSALWLRSRGAAPMPPPVRPAEEVTAYLGDRVVAGTVWVAQSTALEGMLDLAEGWLESLYVAPDRRRRGVGTALLDLAKALSPDGFGLWVFSSNAPARAFYRSQGLVELEETDGSTNDEGVPDVRMAWPGQDALQHLRRLMDDVDGDLAAVIARRVALTRAIQGYKEVPGHPGRDAERESEIARRMAHLSPVLDEEGWRRIMHEVISVSLDRLESEDEGPHGH